MVFFSPMALAQNIQIEFPAFAHKTYEFTIFQGDHTITLQKGTIPKDGKVQLVVPEEHKGYTGMAQWLLTNSQTGGGLDFIINKENFSVTCLDSVPSTENIIYKNTPENVFLLANYQKQAVLFQKHDAMLATLRAYDKNNQLHIAADKEYSSIKTQYVALSKDLAQSPLYAAKFRQIVNATMGIGSIITLDEIEKAKNINNFIVNDLDFAALYTSHHWGGIINAWVQLNAAVLKNDEQLFKDAQTILKRLPNDKIYTDFVTNLTRELTAVGKDDVLFGLVPEIKNSKRLLNYDGVLNLYQQDLTGKAPALVITKNVALERNKDSHYSSVKSKYTLLLFYQSGCGPCEQTIESLLKNYNDLEAKGLKIISISADTDEQIYKNTANQFPWTERFCDLEGFDGVNFKNFAVIGTPTMYVLNGNGYIVKKITTTQELLSWMK